ENHAAGETRSAHERAANRNAGHVVGASDGPGSGAASAANVAIDGDKAKAVSGPDRADLVRRAAKHRAPNENRANLAIGPARIGDIDDRLIEIALDGQRADGAIDVAV